jgi:hypothetical protein
MGKKKESEIVERCFVIIKAYNDMIETCRKCGIDLEETTHTVFAVSGEAVLRSFGIKCFEDSVQYIRDINSAFDDDSGSESHLL